MLGSVRFVIFALLTLLAPISFQAGGAVHSVKAGESIQAALDSAEAGDRVEVTPGVYEESLAIRRDGVALVGLIVEGKRAVLDGGRARLEGIRVEASGVSIEGFVIRNAIASGVVAYSAKDLALRDLIVEDNGLIGVNVTKSQGVRVENCVIGGHASAGILVAESLTVSLAGNESFDNLTGIRIENTEQFEIENNLVSHNTTGIAVLSLPGRSGQSTRFGRAFYNRIFDNNRANTADPGGVDASMTPGVGLYIVAADYVEFGWNRFERNGSYASMVLSLTSSTLPGRKTEVEDPTADHVYIHHNRYADNGNAPSMEFKRDFPGQPPGDMYWDGEGERNQWQEAGKFRTVPESLVQEQGGVHTNVMHFL